MTFIKFIILSLIFNSFSFAAREVRLKYKRDNVQELNFTFKNEYRVVQTDMNEVNKLHVLTDGSYQEKVLENDFEGKVRISKKTTIENITLNGQESDSNTISDGLKTLSDYEYLLDKYKGNIQIIGSKDYRKEDLMNMNVIFPKKALRSGDKWKAKFSYFFNLGKRSKIPVFGKFKLVSVVGGYAKIIGSFLGKIGKTRKINYVGQVKLAFDMLFDVENGYFVSGKITHSLRYESRTKLAKKYKKHTSGKSRLGYKLDYRMSFKEKEEE